jgi:hypothetical protein
MKCSTVYGLLCREYGFHPRLGQHADEGMDPRMTAIERKGHAMVDDTTVGPSCEGLELALS